MAIRRAQLGGQFGGGLQTNAPQALDIAGIVNAVANGSATLLQQAAMRRIARDNAAAQATKEANALSTAAVDKADAQKFRDASFAYKQKQDAAAMAQHHDEQWNANAEKSVADARLQAATDETIRHNKEMERLTGTKQVAPLPGSPADLAATEAKARINAKYRAPQQPHVIPGNDGNLYRIDPTTGAAVQVPVTMTAPGSAHGVSRETPPVTTPDTAPVPASPTATPYGDNMARGLGLPRIGSQAGLGAMSAQNTTAASLPATAAPVASVPQQPRIGTQGVFGKGAPKTVQPKQIPTSAIKDYNGVLTNLQNLHLIEQALNTPEGVDAVGLKNYLPGSLVDRNDPNGVPLRNLIANFASLERLQRSGTAVSANEAKVIGPYLINPTDNAETIRRKLPVLMDFMNSRKQLQEDQFNPTKGYYPLTKPPTEDEIAHQFWKQP